MKKANKYNCIVNNSLYNGIWEITQISHKQMILSRIKYESFETNCGRNDDVFKIQLNNYSNLEKRIVGKHSFKILDDETFLIYPYRQGVPFRFDLIKPEIKLKGLFDEL